MILCIEGLCFIGFCRIHGNVKRINTFVCSRSFHCGLKSCNFIAEINLMCIKFIIYLATITKILYCSYIILYCIVLYDNTNFSFINRLTPETFRTCSVN